MLFIFALSLSVCGLIHGYPYGAPANRCGDMTPGHSVEQNTTNPYSLEVAVREYMPGTAVTVTVRGQFRGVLIQARRANSSEIVGTFSEPGESSDLQLLSCDDVTGSAVTHANPNVKENFTLRWNPPATDVGDVEFIATVLQDAYTWWKNTKSATLSYSSNGGESSDALRLTGRFNVLVISSLFLAAAANLLS